MPACLEFKEILEMNEPEISNLKALGERYENADASREACKLFTRAVRLLEGSLSHTYGLIAKKTRKMENLHEIAEAWQMMGKQCQRVLVTIQDLRNRFPYCGTPELYDLALDYKLACDERYREVEQEIACQQMDFPVGILPKMS